MSISTEITRLQNAKASIKTSIEGKGVTVPSATKLDGYSALIDSIQTGGGGISVEDLAQNIQPSGAITLSDSITQIGDYAFAGKPITNIYGANVASLGTNAFVGTTITSITDSNFPKLGVDEQYILLLRLSTTCTSIKFTGERITLSTGYGALRDNTGLVSAEFPNACVNVGVSYLGMGASCFNGCTNLEIADIGYCNSVGTSGFYNCRKLQTLIMRATSLVSLVNVGYFNNSPFKGYNGLTGVAYVPSALVESYKTATNWSTLYNNGTCTFSAIEGSAYE